MKCLNVLFLVILIDVALASPIKQQSNDDPTHRWTLIPDSEGKMLLIDMAQLDAPVDPLFVPETDTFFLLLTRRNPTAAQIITWNHEVLQNSHFVSSHPTRFTIHGWNGDATARVNTLVAQEYHQHGEFNMITVDWALGGTTLNYITARNRVPNVAKVVADFIDFLLSNNYVRLAELQVIGHSLGGQMSGLIGKEVTRLTGGQIEVIMALDPAGPLFSASNPDERVSPTDGAYVEVIHTNMGRLGFSEPIGQADFFPNFGVIMPGCESDLTGQCSHSRSHLFYAESINRPFTSQECSSFFEIENGQCTPTGRTGLMGGPHPKHGLTGVFYLATNADSPFSRG